MSKTFGRRVAYALALAAAPAFAGPVEVTFVEADRYVDAGNTRWDERQNLQVLAMHLKSLGQRHLPADQSLSVEVLGLDLAGQMWPTRGGWEVRIVRGMADWPRMTVRYTLRDANGQTLRQGQENIGDPGYTFRRAEVGPSDPLRHEKRMLDDWFRKGFAQAPARAGG